MAVLTDEQAEADDRLAAAELAGELVVINEALVDVLLSILHDKNEAEALRSQAAIALGPLFEEMDMLLDDLDEPVISESRLEQIKEVLHQLYRDEETPEDVRRSILEASVRAQQEWLEDAILEAYSNGCGSFRTTPKQQIQTVFMKPASPSNASDFWISVTEAHLCCGSTCMRRLHKRLIRDSLWIFLSKGQWGPYETCHT